MLQTLITCIAVQHEWRLVVLACTVCLLASAVTISLFGRARVSAGTTRIYWLALDACVAGCGIWATHFIAMLAYDPGVPLGYDIGLTILSGLIAIVVTCAGLAVALRAGASAAIGGAIIGFGIAAMHYTGMVALELAGRIAWSHDLVATSVMLGAALSSAAMLTAMRFKTLPARAGAAVLLALAILSHHFTAMGAAQVLPDPTRTFGSLLLSPAMLAVLVAGAATAILGMALVAAVIDRRHDALRERGTTYDAALEHMPQGLCMFDKDGRILLFNDRYAELMGVRADMLRGMTLPDLFRYRKQQGRFIGDPETVLADVRAALRDGKAVTRLMETKDGRAIRVTDQPMHGGGWVATFEDVTEERRTQAQIVHMARHDALTDLPNRTHFRAELDQALHRLAPGEQLAVLCLDLDQFKPVNDSLGHAAGDELLRAVARRLAECCQGIGLAARLGGDEFAVLQTAASQTRSAQLAASIVSALGAPFLVGGRQVVIGASAGIALAPDDASEAERLMRSADLALYRAKNDGRGTYRLFEPGMDARAQARRLLELDLRAAIPRGELALHYQPIHDTAAARITCVEALVRWDHPLRGPIPPAHFMPIAEQTGLIVPLGAWVLGKACADATTWPADVRVAVNLSPAQFNDRGLLELVEGALISAQLPPERLELEIAEQVLLGSTEATLAKLHALRRLGVRISMDDFGTGYSSLSCLRSFQFDNIKIDRSFVHDLPGRSESMAIVRAVAGLGRSLGISTSAEGVETDEQLALLRDGGCTEVQGVLLSRPRPADEIAALLRPSPRTSVPRRPA